MDPKNTENDPSFETTSTTQVNRRGRAGLGLAGLLFGAAAVVTPLALLGSSANAVTMAPVAPVASDSTTADDTEADLDADLEAEDGSYDDEALDDEALDDEDYDDEAYEQWEAEFEAYDQCLTDNGLDLEALEAEFDDLVIVESEDGEVSLAKFGEADGSVTVSKTGDGIEVTADGDVTVGSEDEILTELETHPAFAACEGELPEGLEDWDMIEFDDGEFDFEDFDDDDSDSEDEDDSEDEEDDDSDDEDEDDSDDEDSEDEEDDQ